MRASWVVRRATVSYRGGYCYFRIPKCANSSVLKTLASVDPEINNANTGNVANIKRSSGGLFKANAWSLESLTSRYFCFTFVRNPYTRLLSAYLDKIASAYDDQYQYVARAANVSTPKEVTFEKFVTFLERGGLYANPHWAPQVALLPVNVPGLHFVGRVELLEQDMETLVNMISSDRPFTGVDVRQDRRRGAQYKIASYYSKELAGRVHALYQGDFESFAYPEGLPS